MSPLRRHYYGNKKKNCGIRTDIFPLRNRQDVEQPPEQTKKSFSFQGLQEAYPHLEVNSFESAHGLVHNTAVLYAAVRDRSLFKCRGPDKK